VAPLLLAPSATLAGSAITLDPLEDQSFHIRAVVPRGWTAMGNGLHARQASVGDRTVLGLQAAPMALSSLWPTLMAQLGLTEIPAPVGTRTTDALDWDLYSVDVELAAGDLVADLALAEADRRTYAVLLLAEPDEAPMLHDSVFLPVVDAFAPIEAQPSAPPEGPYRRERVTFPGGADGVTLGGTLTIPDGEGPFAAVVLLSGSGPQDRDESLEPVAAIKPFALIADALTRAGVAVLRYDDRGVGESSGIFAGATVPDFTGDARAAIAFARGHSDIDPARVGVLGHSEGGIHAASLAAGDPAIAFVVGLASPAVPGVEIIVAQNVELLRGTGAPRAALDAAEACLPEVFAAARDGDPVDELFAACTGAIYDALPLGLQASLGERDKYVAQQVRFQVPVITSPWYRSLLASDAGADFARVRVPVLGLYGGKDVQVPAAQNAPALEAALDRPDAADHDVVILPDANHLFQAAQTGWIAEYGTLAQEFTPELLPTLVEWVVEHASAAP
jgi:pimeloyl-ACP methyl ester carboxylesterase